MATKMYRATVASMRAIYGNRLRPEQYRTMMSLHTVPDIAAYLKQTDAYRNLLEDIEPSVMHRKYLESALQRAVFQQYLHSCRLEQLQNTPFFRFIIMDYEIRELLKAIQLLPQGDSGLYFSQMHGWLAPYTAFSLEKLAQAKSYAEILEVTRHTVYYGFLKPFLAQKDGDFPYFACEIAMRAGYMQHLLDETARLMRGKNRDALTNLIREQIDLINLINAYRLKSVFHTDGETLRSLMLPIQGLLLKRVCTALYDAPDMESFWQILSHTRYGHMLESQSMLSHHRQMEHSFQILRCRTAKNALRFSDHALVTLYAAHHLHRVEVDNLTTIIEGIRYDQPPAYLESLIIMNT